MGRVFKVRSLQRSDFDVVVVGGGPSGSAAAITCALAGVRVTVLERSPFPRERPGETLHPGVEPILSQLGVLDRILDERFVRHAGHWTDWGGDRRFLPFGSDEEGPWLGFQVMRSVFDAILLDRARDVGCVVHQPASALAPIVEKGRVTGIRTQAGELRTSVVIDATGDRQWLARALCLRLRTASSRLVVRYGYAAGTPAMPVDAPLLRREVGGWAWIARIGDGIWAWSRLRAGVDPGTTAPDELAGCRALGTARGADVTWRLASPSAGPGYFLAGDAASLLDPASSHGVLKALMTGVLAGDCVARIYAGEASAEDSAAAYSRWLSDWFVADATQLAEFYAQPAGEIPAVGDGSTFTKHWARPAKTESA